MSRISMAPANSYSNRILVRGGRLERVSRHRSSAHPTGPSSRYRQMSRIRSLAIDSRKSDRRAGSLKHSVAMTLFV